MSDWTDLTPRTRAEGLSTAVCRRTANGERFAFVHRDVEIDDPSVDSTGRQMVSPKEYGFSIRGFSGGKTAWARDFSNGMMLVTNADGRSHVLSQRAPARILFVGIDGQMLQDTGLQERAEKRVAERVTVRLTVSAVVDLGGDTPEAARTLMMRLVEHALQQGPASVGSPMSVQELVFETSTVQAMERRRATDTDFSQLLDF